LFFRPGKVDGFSSTLLLLDLPFSLFNFLLSLRFISLPLRFFQSLVLPESFQHILRIFNTNIKGTQNIIYALTSIKGVGRRFSTLVCKRAGVDIKKRFVILNPFLHRLSFISFSYFHALSICLSIVWFISAGELKPEEVDRITEIIEHPQDHRIPEYFLNHRRDLKDGTSSHATSQQVDVAVRDAIERLKKIRSVNAPPPALSNLSIFCLVPIAVCATCAVCVCVVSIRRRLAATDILLVSRRRREDNHSYPHPLHRPYAIFVRLEWKTSSYSFFISMLHNAPSLLHIAGNQNAVIAKRNLTASFVTQRRIEPTLLNR
jgi:ribosomal protein S13